MEFKEPSTIQERKTVSEIAKDKNTTKNKIIK
jgi:hypothetical protein